jgi:hypothetical protein
MANTNSPFGFRSFGHRDGSAPTMGMTKYTINSSDANLYFTGDPVALSSAAYGVLSPYNGSSLAPRMVGIFAGCEYYNPSIGRVTWNSFFPGSVSSSSPVTAYVIDDPDMQFVVQASSAGFGSSMVGGNANILSGQSSLGNQTTGISNVTLASSMGLVAGSSYPFSIVDAYSNFAPPGVNGTDNSSAYNWMIVVPNNTFRRAPVTGVTT